MDHYNIDISHFQDEALPNPPRRRYTKEALQDATSRSNSIREVIEYLGIPPYDSAYNHIERRLAHFGIDTSHFNPARPQAQVIDTDELRAIVAQSRTFAEVLRALGLPNSGASRAKVKKNLIAQGIPTHHFVGQGHNRGRSSPRRKTATEILQRLSPGSSRTNRRLLHRALQEMGVPYICGKCGTGEVWYGYQLVLEIDHINGDRLDNRMGNLRYLCPSCHSQTASFARRTANMVPPHQRRPRTSRVSAEGPYPSG
ncbi:HNH endonuclease [Streptomyces silvisoli]|uniref:HNH endonuclease n=1 Tax=Streptomyces silvisoli TaxID=3034235 RepID=A0ABT5ZSW2_9ACTN|nr:HNH endonuclease [Streptomyces silvisoli]MDF3292912.1 HNH endonuclease [Streptomyces silvisoli]